MQRASKVRVILDTNFLMIPGQFKVDIFAELQRLMNTPYDVCVFEATIGELTKFASGQRKDKVAATIGLQLIKQQNLKILPNSIGEDGLFESYLDAVIINNVIAGDIVCTQDRDLKRALKPKGVQIMTLKSGRHVDFG